MSLVEFGDRVIFFGRHTCPACEEQLQFLKIHFPKVSHRKRKGKVSTKIWFFDTDKYTPPAVVSKLGGVPVFYLPTGNGRGILHLGQLTTSHSQMQKYYKHFYFTNSDDYKDYYYITV